MLLGAVFLYILEEEISHSMELDCRKGKECQIVLVTADKMSDKIQGRFEEQGYLLQSTV